MGNSKKALANYEKAIALKPDYTIVYYIRGCLRFETKDYRGALADYDKCIDLDPENELAYNNRGAIKSRLEDLDGALADYNKAIALDPNDAFAFVNRADLYRKLAQKESDKGKIMELQRKAEADDKMAADLQKQ